MLPANTIAAVATAPGDAGIAVIRVSGPGCSRIARRIFRPHSGGDPANYRGYTLHYGRFVSPEEETVDDGLLATFRAPHSYTGEDALELSLHGGRSVTARILRLVLQAGAHPAAPGEFTQRAFLNGRLDLAQAEAVADLIRARTDVARRAARRQLEGGLSRKVAALNDELIGILAAIEVTIDFSDEVGELDYPALQVRLSRVRAGVASLLATADYGRIVREGVRVALIGRPNVGKSSLLNALLRADRAIVTPVAGTTRDVIEESASLGDLPVALIDTAGIRDTTDPVERIGVERAEAAWKGSDLVVLVVDAVGLTAEDVAIAERKVGQEAGRLLLAVNKIDTVSATELAVTLAGAGAALGSHVFATVPVSALIGTGIEALESALSRAAAAFESEGSFAEADQEAVIVVSERHRESLARALQSLQEAEDTAARRLPGDFIAIDGRGALDALGSITGETVTEDIVHRIFRDFCVGK